jgi:hypothetical protein
MAIREATTSVEEPRPSGPRPDRRRRRRDLRAGPFPTAAMDQWHDTEAALTQLYRHAEGRAIEAIDWYLQDKRGKRIWSRGLRLLVILLLQYDWAAECARGASRTVDPKQVQNRLALLRVFSDDVAASCSRRPPSGCSSSRATSCAWSGSAPTAPAPAPGRYHCRAPPSPRRGRRPGADAQRPRTRAGGAAQAARRRQGVPLTWRASNGSWPGCGSRRRRPTCGTSRSVPGG